MPNKRKPAQPDAATSSLALSALKPDLKNANRGTDRGRKMVADSVQNYGFGRSLLVDKNNRVIAGNKTLEAALASGSKLVRVVETDGTELVVVRRSDLDLIKDKKAKALAIADNRASELGLDWDPAVLQSLDVDLAQFFTDRELGAILAGLESGSTANDDVPDKPAKPRTKHGTLFALGRHRLMCGDSTNTQDMQALTMKEPVDMVWTDPPYGVEYEGKTKKRLVIENDALDPAQMAVFLRAAFSQCAAALKAGGAIYVAHADVFGHIFRSAFLDSDIMLKQCLIWVKNNSTFGRPDYHWQHEPILYGWTGGGAHHWYSDRKQTTVLNFDMPTKSTVHPTMKPVALVEYCVRNSSAPKGIVLDPFGGSGTTLMACEASDRSCVTMELDPGYCDVIIERWETATGGKAVPRGGIVSGK